MSDTDRINSGVPQGSILGPLLFLSFINDFQSNISAKLILFADDTTAIIQGKSINQLQANVRVFENQLMQWLDVNKLSLNCNKTKYMTFNCENVHLNLYNTQIETVEVFKILGILLHKNLKFTQQCNQIVTKLNKYKPMFYYLKHKFPIYLTRFKSSEIINNQFKNMDIYIIW